MIKRTLWPIFRSRVFTIGVGLMVAMTFVTITPRPAEGGVNSDGNADIVFVNYSLASLGPPWITEESCLGNGLGSFSCVPFNKNDRTQGLATGDVDGDGDVDVILANEDVRAKVCLNDGGGSFSCVDIDASNLGGLDAATGDFDGDSYLDIILATSAPNQVCFNDGDGVFSVCSDVDPRFYSGTTIPMPYFSFGVDVGDVDGDGTLDAVFSNNAGEPNRVCLNDGSRGFSCADVASEMGVAFGRVALGLLDADGKLDVVFADGSANRVCIGNGTGNFTGCKDVDTTTTGWSEDVALGYVDGDGILDAVFAGGSGSSRLCLGSGGADFRCSDIPRAPGTTGWETAVDTGYIDGGGTLDLAFASPDGNNTVCLGSGAGVFSCVAQSSMNLPTTDVAIIPATSPNDSDNDGVLNEDDGCSGTRELGTATTRWLRRNRFAVDIDGNFVDRKGTPSGFTIVDTSGCDESQIITNANLGKVHKRFGLSRDVLKVWVARGSLFKPK